MGRIYATAVGFPQNYGSLVRLGLQIGSAGDLGSVRKITRFPVELWTSLRVSTGLSHKNETH